MEPLASRIERATSFGGSATFMSGDTGVTVPWTEVHDDARAMAAALQVKGIGPGDHVAVLGPTTRPLVTLIQATWLSGATIMLLPLPMRLGSIDEFVSQTRVRVIKGDAALLVIDEQLADFLTAEPGDPPMIRLDELDRQARLIGSEAFEAVPSDLERLVILQFTSGSTAEPKGVMLPDRALCSNLDAAARAGRLQDDDVFVSWLPLYHDMGLVGMLTLPMTTGRSMVLGAPQDFLAKPLRWMRWLSDNKGTVTAGPNFSWVLATKALRRGENLDLSPLRIALNGAEPIDPRCVEAFIAEGARFGMRPGAVFPAFGMAEVAIAGAFPVPLQGLRTDAVDQRVLETERYAAPSPVGDDRTREFVKLGTAVPGLEFRIVDPDDGLDLSDREVGELWIRGTSLMTGYYKNPEATSASMVDGWLRTGDLAYLLEGDLIICGRIKDVIIMGGRNVFPEDIERGVAMVDGVRPGNVMAFGIDGAKGKEQLIVVAEVKVDDHAEVRHAIAHRVGEVCGIPPHDVVLASAGTLPKTSSGKLQRTLCKQRYLAGQLDLVSA